MPTESAKQIQTAPRPTGRGREACRIARPILLLGIWLPALTIVGCATHADRIRDARTAYYVGELELADQLLQKAQASHPGARDCLNLDQAMVSLSQGNASHTEDLLRQVRDQFDHLEEKAIGESVLALVTDDTANAYHGEDYEKVLIRAMLAVSNLMQDGSDVIPYCLQTDQKQQEVLTRAKEKAAAKGEQPSEETELGQVALGAYLRGIVQEESHLHYDDAVRAFGTVATWEPQFELVRYDLERARTGTHSAKGNGVVYLFAMVGRGPHKEEAVAAATSISLLIADRILSMAGEYSLPPTIAPVKIPQVVIPACSIESVAVDVGNQPVGLTQTVTDVGRLAQLQCAANRNRRIAHAVVRRSLKKGAIYAVKDATGVESPMVNLAYDAAGVLWEATEKADTRCWSLLPAKIQVLRIELPAGTHQLTLRPARYGRPVGPSYQANVEVTDGRNTYMLATFPGERLLGKILTSQQATRL
jgi:hypothetical protein